MVSDETIGATLGSYKVTAKLGQGGMGAVYLAEHPLLGRKAAVKILLPELSSHKDSVDRFFHEARTTARLRHPAMVDVFDFGTLPDGRAYLIMDYLEGDSLEARVRNRGALSVTESLRITREIALGVSVAHAEQIVHRDLKPDNIFLMPPVAGNRDERVKILDFGIAKLGRKAGQSGGVGVTRVGAVMGTPLYMSPEQCRGAAEVDHRADIYALGCILFSMLSGRPPFLSESMGELMGLHQLAPPPTLDSLGVTVPRSVERLIQSMLAKHPDHRPQTMVAVADQIGRILRDEGLAPGRLFSTVALPSADVEATTQRGRGAAVSSPLLDKTTPDPRTEQHLLDLPAGQSGTLDGRSVVTEGTVTFTGASRWPLAVGAVAAAVALSALAIFMVGRDPSGSDRPARAAGSSSSDPPAVERADPRRQPEPVFEPLAVPSVEPPAPPASAVPPGQTGGASPISGPAGAAATNRALGGRAAGIRRTGTRTDRQARAQVTPPAQPPVSSAPDKGTHKVSDKVTEKTAEKAPETGKDTTKPKPPRPVYRGTQLQIEKEVPYD